MSGTVLLQQSILQLCNEHINYNEKLQILGILCVTIDDKPHEIVIKINNTLKRVLTAESRQVGNSYRSGKSQTQTKVLMGSEGSAMVNQAYHVNPYHVPMSAPREVKNMGPYKPPYPPYVRAPALPPAVTVSSSSTSSKTFNSLYQKLSDLRNSNNNAEAAEPKPSPSASAGKPEEKESAHKSGGRKSKKPTKVVQVFQDGVMSDEDDEDGLMTVLPVAPDHDDSNDSEQEVDDLVIDDVAPTSSSTPVKPLHVQVKYSNSNRVSSSTGREIGETRPLVVLQEDNNVSSDQQEARDSENRGWKLMDSSSVSPVAHQGPNGAQSIKSSPVQITLPIMVAPQLDGTNFHMAVDQPPQDEAIDFSMSQSSRLSSNMIQRDFDDSSESSMEDRSGSVELAVEEDMMKVKKEPRDDSGYHSSMVLPLSAPLTSPGLAASQSLFSNRSALFNQNLFQSPFAGGLPLVNGLHGLSPPRPVSSDSLAGLNHLSALNLSALSRCATSPSSTVGLPFLTGRPYLLSSNSNYLAGESAYGDVSSHGSLVQTQQPTPHKKRNMGSQEDDYMLDKMGQDPKKRRRRGPEETLTAEEIAEYMGASGSHNITGTSFKCKYCSIEIGDLVQYLQHTLTVHSAYVCHQCGKSFTTKSSLLRHRPIHTGLRRYACSVCKKTFYRKDKCKSHIKRHLGPNDQHTDNYDHIETIIEGPQEVRSAPAMPSTSLLV